MPLAPKWSWWFGLFALGSAESGVQKLQLARPSFSLSAAADLQDRLFRAAAQDGWLGADKAVSLGLRDGRYLWVFGDTLTNLTEKGAVEIEGSGLQAGCNFFPADRCAMPSNTFGIWDSAKEHHADALAPISFYVRFDSRSGQPTSTIWAPGWGGLGRTAKTPSCTGCALWLHDTALRRTVSQCKASGADNVQPSMGGCCASKYAVCSGYCCHQEFYFKPTTGIASRTDNRVLLLGKMAKESDAMRNRGETFGTFAVIVRDAYAVPPPDWNYTTDRMPGTAVWPWSSDHETVHFHSAITSAHDQAYPDLVYILGRKGNGTVLARANLTDLFERHWNRVEFFAGAPSTWAPYHGIGDLPELSPLWESAAAATFSYNEWLGMWLAVEVDASHKSITFRVATWAVGPYTTWDLGPLPVDLVRGSSLGNWDVTEVKSHPELASDDCSWVLSVVLNWKPADHAPPTTGLHNFPRLVCVSVQGGLEVKRLTSTVTYTTTLPDTATCNTEQLIMLESTMACSDLGDGCHTCQERAQWIVQHNGNDLFAAYGIVANEFPHECGQALACTAQLVQRAGFPVAKAKG